MKHHTCGCRSKGFPILPIGLVNLTTGKNQLFEHVWDCWEQDEKCANILCFDTEKMRYMAVHDTSFNDKFTKDDTMNFCHDQTNARIGTTWRIIGKFPHTINGNADMKRECGKSSISFATFK